MTLLHLAHSGSKSILGSPAACAAFLAFNAAHSSGTDNTFPRERRNRAVAGGRTRTAGAWGEEDDDGNWSNSDSDVTTGWGPDTPTHSDGESDNDQCGGEWGEEGDGDAGGGE